MIVNILAFNLGEAKKTRFSNGPGNSLLGLLRSISHIDSIKVRVFLALETEEKIPGIEICKLDDFFPRSSNEIIHWWSGLTRPHLFRVTKFANNPCIIGPNLIDGTQIDSAHLPTEESVVKLFPNATYLTLNNQLKFSLSRSYGLSLEQIQIFKSGPDLSTWKPPDKYERFILWKGAGNQYVKDLPFAQEVRNRLPEYRFVLMGEDGRFSYSEHIDTAKRAWLYFSTSISETMGMTLLEQWSAGVPSVTNPKVMLHGINYDTGIVTNKDLISYCTAINEIMQNDQLREHLSCGAKKYILENFSNDKICQNYLDILKNVC